MAVQRYMNKNHSHHRSDVTACGDKKIYEKPKLTPLGDIRDVTMGGSPGFGDSGAAAPERPF